MADSSLATLSFIFFMVISSVVWYIKSYIIEKRHNLIFTEPILKVQLSKEREKENDLPLLTPPQIIL